MFELTTSTVLTVLLPWATAYSIASPETISLNIPASATTSSVGNITLHPPLRIDATSGSAAVILGGSLAENASESALRDNSSFLTVTLSGDTWSNETLTSSMSRALIESLSSMQEEARGFNMAIQPAIQVEDVARLDSGTLQILLSATPSYAISCSS